MCWDQLTWSVWLLVISAGSLVRTGVKQNFSTLLGPNWNPVRLQAFDVLTFAIFCTKNHPHTRPLHRQVHTFLAIRCIDYSLMMSKAEIWGPELSRLSWNTDKVRAMNRGGDLCANPTIDGVSTEGFSIKATAAALCRSPNRNPRSSGSGLMNIQITAAQLSRLKSMFPFFPSSLVPAGCLSFLPSQCWHCTGRRTVWWVCQKGRNREDVNHVELNCHSRPS